MEKHTAELLTPSPTANDVVLSAQGLSLTRDNNVALAGASIALSSGEMVALVGRSGSGKSTLLHCLAGLLVPDSGTIEYRGQRIDSLDAEARARLRLAEFGFVLQFGQLVPELSAEQNVSIPLRLTGVAKHSAQQRARHMLGRLGVEHVAKAHPGSLSGGEQQRVAIARALVHRPRVVFADEPTGALDSSNGESVARLLAEVASEQGAAVLIATHDAELATLAHRTVVVADGVTRSLGSSL